MKTAKSFSKEAESRLLGAVKEMTAYVEGDGLSPDNAIAKVASDSNLPRDWVPLMVQAHNHGRTTYQRDRTSPALLEKLAEFPLASTEGVLAIMFPNDILSPGDESEKTAVSAEYDRPPTWAAEYYKAAESFAIINTPMEKVASLAIEPIARDPDCVMTEKFAAVTKLISAKEAASQATYRAKMDYLAAMGRLGDHFKGNDANFAKAAYWAEHLFGKPGKHAMDFVRARNQIKVAALTEAPSDGQPVNPDCEPYCVIKDAISVGTHMVESRRKEAAAQVRWQQAHDEVFRPFVQTPTEAPSHTSGSPNSQSSKEAGAMSGVFGGMGLGLARSFGQHNEMPSSQTPSQLSSSLANDLADPEHEQAIRQIQVRSMLNDMLANDEVISGYEPDEVMTAYNEIASLSPRASEQAAVMRPLLRKRLTAGSVEPFEAQQMADIEKTITQTSVPDLTSKVAGVINGNPILATA